MGSLIFLFFFMALSNGALFAQEQILGLTKKEAILLFPKLGYQYLDSTDPSFSFNKSGAIPKIIFRWDTKGVGGVKFDLTDRVSSFEFLFEPSKYNWKGMKRADLKKAIKELTSKFGKAKRKTKNNGTVLYSWVDDLYIFSFTISGLMDKDGIVVCLYNGSLKSTAR